MRALCGFLQYAAGRSSATFFVSILFLAGCAPAPPSFYIAPEYRDKGGSDVSIAVLPYVGKLMSAQQWEAFIARKTKESKLVTNLEIELFEGFFPALLSEKTHARVVSYNKSDNSAGIQLQSRMTDIGFEPKMDLLIPASEKVQVSGEIPDFLFIVQDLFFMKQKLDGPGIQVPGRGNAVDYSMESGIDYLVWDNKNYRIAACGKLTKATRLLAPPGREQYLKVLDDFVDSIVRNSPLSQKTISY